MLLFWVNIISMCRHAVQDYVQELADERKWMDGSPKLQLLHDVPGLQCSVFIKNGVRRNSGEPSTRSLTAKAH